MQTLADRFDEAGGDAITFEGRELRRDFTLPVANQAALIIEFLKYTDHPIQGLGLKAERCSIAVAGTIAKNIGLWTDTAPRRVELRVQRAGKSAAIRFFNQWRDEKYGSTMYHLNNAAMEVEQQPDGSFLLKCSDGWSTPNFEDLVVRVSQASSR
jgi:hypothetical protein